MITDGYSAHAHRLDVCEGAQNAKITKALDLLKHLIEEFSNADEFTIEDVKEFNPQKFRAESRGGSRTHAYGKSNIQTLIELDLVEEVLNREGFFRVTDRAMVREEFDQSEYYEYN